MMRYLACLCMLLLLTTVEAAHAQTPEVPAPSPPAHTVHKKPVAKKPSAKKSAVKPHVPVLAPRHSGPPRRAAPAKPPVHPARKEVHHAAAKIVLAPKPAPKPPEPPPLPPNIGTVTKLPLPRYASLKTDDINMRIGPNERYPIIWTYKRAELPVKIEREFDVWRLVEDMDGVKGWVHQATLTGRRSFVITGTENRILRTDPSATAETVAILKPGVVGRIRSCEAGKDWCQVQVQDYRGYLERSAFWGAEPGEVVTP